MKYSIVVQDGRTINRVLAQKKIAAIVLAILRYRFLKARAFPNPKDYRRAAPVSNWNQMPARNLIHAMEKTVSRRSICLSNSS